MIAADRLQRGWRRASSRLTHVGMIFVVLVLTSCGAGERPADTVAVPGADTDEYGGTLVEPSLQVAPVTLRDTDNRAVRLDRLTTEAGVITAVFFGFTNCTDICPTTMADLAAARRALPADLAQRTHLVFVTVDPRRDSEPVLRAWLDQFDPAIAGLRGPVNRVHRAERSLYASESGQSAPTPPENDDDDRGKDAHEPADPKHELSDYQVDHTSIVYLFGPEGESVIYTGSAPVRTYVQDFSRLLR